MALLVVTVGLLWAAARWYLRRSSLTHVPVALLKSYAVEGSKVGWLDGPVWRTPAEIARMKENQ
jgi:hypothetical protein